MTIAKKAVFYIDGREDYPSATDLNEIIDAINGGGSVGTTLDAKDTPGTIVGNVEVFDADGASLGFIAVYDAFS